MYSKARRGARSGTSNVVLIEGFKFFLAHFKGETLTIPPVLPALPFQAHQIQCSMALCLSSCPSPTLFRYRANCCELCKSSSMQLGSRVAQRLWQSFRRDPNSPIITGKRWHPCPSAQYPCAAKQMLKSTARQIRSDHAVSGPARIETDCTAAVKVIVHECTTRQRSCCERHEFS